MVDDIETGDWDIEFRKIEQITLNHTDSLFLKYLQGVLFGWLEMNIRHSGDGIRSVLCAQLSDKLSPHKAR
jgi:hypothetical protein